MTSQETKQVDTASSPYARALSNASTQRGNDVFVASERPRARGRREVEVEVRGRVRGGRHIRESPSKRAEAGARHVKRGCFESPRARVASLF